MSDIKEIIIDFVKNSYPVKLDVLAQTLSRKANTFNYNLFEILDELIVEKKIYILKNNDVYFIFPESIEIVSSMFNSEKKKPTLYIVSIIKNDFNLDIGFDFLPRLTDVIEKVSLSRLQLKNSRKDELISLLKNNIFDKWPENDNEFSGTINPRDFSIFISFDLK